MKIWKNKRLNKLLRLRFLEALSVIVLVGVVLGVFVWLSGQTSNIAEKGLEISRRPEAEIHYSSVASKLRERRFDLEMIADLVLTRERVGEFVATLEALAANDGLEIRVPLISDNEEDEDEVIRKVTLQVVVTGDAKELLAWLTAVEYLPNLIRIANFELEMNQQRKTTGSGAPSGAQAPEGEERPEVIIPEATLKTDIVLGVKENLHEVEF